MDIDWSKAPEGATHYDPLDNNWLRQVVGTALVWCGGGTGWGEKTWQYNNDLSTMRRLIVRALPWNGEGLPPVGTVCEAQWKVPHKGDTRFHKCLIIHHASKDEAVAISLEADMDSCPFWVGLARLIRTAEQIAAEERAAAIEDMWSTYWKPEPQTAKEALGLLWDAGYRKVKAGQ